MIFSGNASKRAGLFILLMIGACLPLMTFAQTAEIPSRSEPYLLNSGEFSSNPGATQPYVAYSGLVEVAGVPWMRLNFLDANLGSNSYLIITSLQDGAWQRLDAISLAQWSNTSAYFNGDAVEIALHVAPGDQNVFVMVDEVTVGEWAQNAPIESQCGPTDDRLPSDDPRSGRIVPIGCTGWIITNGKYLTAGHCSTGSAQVLEFNVPLSTSSGTIQHPGPEDQYAIDQTSFQSTNGGVGNDWGVYNTFPNSVTGLTAIQAQGAAFWLVQDYSPVDIRITGYGVEFNDPEWNQIQQTHVGPNTGSSSNTMRYQTDTEGGNSGSPVIDEATGFAVGIHTHGGCSTSGTGNNSGTSTFHPAFWAAADILSSLAPASPDSLTAYSDYTTPNSMLLTWQDPVTLLNGDPLSPDSFSVEISRDGAVIDTVSGGIAQYVDVGLVDGTEYAYEIFAFMNSSGFGSPKASASWIAGGSPIPNPPTAFSVAGSQQEVTVSWVNPAQNVDGTPLDDLAGVNLFQNGVLVETFLRSGADSARTDTATYTPAAPGYYAWHITVVDNESAQNESASSDTVDTPLSLPVFDAFADPGDPNPGLWVNTNTDINDRADNPPSGAYALNFNGKPDGDDALELKPLDLSGMAGTGMRLRYYYQPQGNGNAPEPEDSLRVHFKNDLGNWVLIKSYPGTTLQPFVLEEIDIESAPNGGGSYFFGQFQVRFSSIGGAGFFPNDDWFIDDVEVGMPGLAIEDESGTLPLTYEVKPNYPNPFNPSTTIAYQLPRSGEVALEIYNALGQKVRTLVNQHKEAGFHQAQWDGRNDRGLQVASGIYIYRFAAGDFRQVRKMILLK